jgi:hypothetical protein
MTLRLRCEQPSRLLNCGAALAFACCSFAWVKYFHDKRHYKGTTGQRKPEAPKSELSAAERSKFEQTTPRAFVVALLVDKQGGINMFSQFRGVCWDKTKCAASHVPSTLPEGRV